MTIKQIIDAQQPHPDADFKVDGDAINQITFVGQIRNVSNQTTNITYKVDDGTGTVEVKQWIDSDTANMDGPLAGDPSKAKLVENAYCRVWGRLKAFNNKRHVGAHMIRPVTDYNEVNYHLLEATAVHLYFTRGPPPSAGANGQHGADMNGGSTFNDAESRNLRSLSPLARRILQYMKDAPQSNEGFHVQMLASQVHAAVADVYKATEELVGHSILFTTVDDNTWALLDI